MNEMMVLIDLSRIFLSKGIASNIHFNTFSIILIFFWVKYVWPHHLKNGLCIKWWDPHVFYLRVNVRKLVLNE